MHTEDDLPELDIDAAAIEAELSDELSPAATLAKVSSGGAVLVALAQQRLSDALAAVREGRFTDANRLIQEAASKIGPLATVEYSIATFAGTTRIARAVEVTEGMMVMGMGRVVKTDHFTVQHTSGDDCHHVKLHFEDGEEYESNGQREMLVEIEKDEPS